MENRMNTKYSTVTIRETQEKKSVRILPGIAGQIPDDIINKWQSIIDTVAKIANVPAGLIMRLNENTIEVFLRSLNDGNPYEPGEEAELIHGLYCETVVGTQKKLLIPDATKSEVWGKNNPDIDINMISYLGFPVNWPNGNVFGTVCLLDNKENHYSSDYSNLLYQISQHLETDLRLIISNNELTENNIVKELLLDIITHDLKSPAGNIDNIIELILEDSPKVEYLDIIKDSSKNLLNVIENASTLSQVAIGEKIKTNKTNIRDMIEEVAKDFIPILKENNMSLNIDLDEDLVVNANPVLSQVFSNYISNAVKYAADGGEIIINNIRSDNEYVVINVIDFGTTISGTNRLSIFDRKIQLDRRKRGHGLGLAIVKRIATAHNAEVGVKPNFPKGNNFFISLPLNPIDDY